MAWWSREKGVQTVTVEKKSVPKGIWIKCETCEEILYGADLEENLRVCRKCEHHFPLPAEERLRLVLDEGFLEGDMSVASGDPLGFRIDNKKYRDRVRASRKSTGVTDAYRAVSGRIGGI